MAQTRAEFIYDPPTEPLELLHSDADLLVVNKPSGLLSVPGKAAEHADCLLSRVVAECPDALLVHRLDMDTSGIMVFARNKNAQRHLGLQFERRHLRKEYQALVVGRMDQSEGEVDLPLIVDWPNRPLQRVDHQKGKHSVTRWQALHANDTQTRVALFPETGRSHQLRVHMLAIGHPILGDRFYGDADVIARSDRLCLHAHKLHLRHPEGGEWISFVSEVPF